MYHRHWVRLVGSLLLFLAAGTAGLAGLLYAASQRLSHSDLVALAKANAGFIRNSTENYYDEMDEDGPDITDQEDFVNAPPPGQAGVLSGYLGQLLGVEVRFQSAPPLDARHESVTARVDPGMYLTLVHARPLLGDVLRQPASLAVLGGFWTLWLVLAWAVTIPFFKTQRFVLLGRMTASLAHEIRNPIAAIRLHGQLLERTEQAQPASASLIVQEAAKIEDMVSQWMFLTRPEPPRQTEIALVELLEKTTRVLAPAAEHAKVQVVITALCHRRVRADSQRLGQVFHNITLNAIQAMPVGGILSITVSENDVSFADTGPGFSPKALRRGAKGIYSEKEGGMGLGLVVARSIVRAHGGRLAISNQPAGGAIVRISL